MKNIQILHRDRRPVAGNKLDFIYIPDQDFRNLMEAGPYPLKFVSEHQEGEVPVVLVSYPSLTAAAPEGIDFIDTLIRDIAPDLP